MKKIVSTILIAVIGGVSAIVVEKQFSSNNEHTQLLDYKTNPIPVKFTSAYGSSASTTGIDFTTAAEQSINAVVHIKTTIEETQNNLAYDPFHNYFYGQPQQRIQEASGSGVIISKDGYIVTNNHVVNGATKIQVVLNDKRTYTGELIGADPQTDVALVKIKADELPFLTYGNSDNVKVGEWALAVGNPFNLTSTVTAGIISAKGRNINIFENDPAHGIFPIESFIQTDAAVNPGNSGGALVNTSGELVGINTAIASQTGSYAGYSFAIPVNIVKKIVADMVEYGVVQRAFIGVSIRDIDSKFAEANKLKSMNGVFVNGITDETAEAGVHVGDVITKVENNLVRNVPELQEQIGKYRPGDKVNVTVMRDNSEVIVPVILKNKDGNIGVIKKEVRSEASVGALGASFESLSKEEMKKLAITNGIRIKKLDNGKLASAGIKQGFIITSVDKKKVASAEELESILKDKSGMIMIEGMYPNGIHAYYTFHY
ncbi:MAG: periplasmic serine protease, Do/DeqQ family [Bacteroidetes bacterium]|jgi:Do/DeqQ family serine protease|nr:periplasmic serine protease, Do/DeqQ family [Bacteroidota bacterium]